MTQVVTVGESKETKPPQTWGVIEWQMPDGMNAQKAQKLMQSFVEYTHSIGALCGELKIPIGTAETYLVNAASIPKGVYWKLPRLVEAMKKNPARAKSIARRIENVSKWSAQDINDDAAGKAGFMFAEARKRLHLRQKDVADKCNIHTTTLSRYEMIGAMPIQKGFFVLCEFYKIVPETLGFVADQAREIQKWRMGMRQ